MLRRGFGSIDRDDILENQVDHLAVDCPYSQWVSTNMNEGSETKQSFVDTLTSIHG